MNLDAHRRVAAPPPRPLMIFDGDCHFCRRWIERWREITDGGVDYFPFQEVAERFPEIPKQSFERAVHFIEPDGEVYAGAEAVYRSLGHKPSRSRLHWTYEHVPGFRTISEIAYAFIARHRELASIVTRLLWGEDVRRPTYVVAQRWFLRCLGIIYLIAFLSLWVQVDGLIGERGILPAGEFLTAAHAQLGSKATVLLPTLCWFGSSNSVLHLLCGSGAAVSIVLILGFVPVASLVILFALYLSLTIGGQTFLSFQWDILLLETGFLAIFFAPMQWWAKPGNEAAVSRLGLFLLKFLLFKLMVMSGVVKLTSGDPSWWDLTALNYHYETQPLPTILGWWAHQSPEWFRHFSTLFVLVVETVVPFFIWTPRRIRLAACALLFLLQILIALTGNYCFFNLLTIALCLLLIDDVAFGQKPARVGTPPSLCARSQHWLAVAVLIVTLPLNAMLLISAFKPEVVWPRALEQIYSSVESFRIANGYGLFRVMTKSRPEIVIEGSADGIDWIPYEFKWKPGDVRNPPGWVAPHQPRLDWQMWFAALGSYQQNPWFLHLTERLLTNSPDVVSLFARNPFPNKPPRYVRSTLYDYHFTTIAEHRQTGAWWKREERGEYLPVVSLRDR